MFRIACMVTFSLTKPKGERGGDSQWVVKHCRQYVQAATTSAVTKNRFDNNVSGYGSINRIYCPPCMYACKWKYPTTVRAATTKLTRHIFHVFVCTHKGTLVRINRKTCGNINLPQIIFFLRPKVIF